MMMRSINFIFITFWLLSLAILFFVPGFLVFLMYVWFFSTTKTIAILHVCFTWKCETTHVKGLHRRVIFFFFRKALFSIDVLENILFCFGDSHNK